MIRKILLLVLSFFLLTGCQKDIQQINIDYTYSDPFAKKVFISGSECKLLENPCDIAWNNDLLYVVNQGNDNILIFDKDGKLVNTFGTSGQGQGEFLNPEAIAIAKDYIYVVEQDSCRIQIFTKDLSFYKELKMDKLANDASVRALDIEADETGNIYLSVKGTKSKLLNIYAISKNGKIRKIGKNMIGVLGKDPSGNIYFAQSFEYIKNGYQDGESFVGLITKKFKKKFDLPHGYSPLSICVSDSRLYLFSYSRCQIDEFTMDGSYVKTIYHENPSVENAEVKHMTMYNNKFYMSDSKNNIIYMFEDSGN